MELPCFGEVVEYKKPPKKTTKVGKKGYFKLERRWELGIYLGIKETSTERIVGTSTGVRLVQSIQRVPENRRFDGDMMDKLVGLPWELTPCTSEEAAMPLPIPIVPEVSEAPKEPPKPFEKVMQYRRHYIVKADLEAYGYSLGCPACEETRTGRSRRVFHTPSHAVR